MHRDILEEAIKFCCSADTASDPMAFATYDDDYSQDDVSALVMQDYLRIYDTDIKSPIIYEENYRYGIIDCDVVYDLRPILLSDFGTKVRYSILADRVRYFEVYINGRRRPKGNIFVPSLKT